MKCQYGPFTQQVLSAGWRQVDRYAGFAGQPLPRTSILAQYWLESQWNMFGKLVGGFLQAKLTVPTRLVAMRRRIRCSLTAGKENIACLPSP